MKKLAIVLTFVFGVAMIAPAFAQEAKKAEVKKENKDEKGCAKDCSKTCSSKEAKACCSKEAKPEAKK
ncbi:MAG TPA: hypothetical protein VN249_12980 [Prolixibacteraceae bacterium]|jgi:hypothetical protein|nr:hypothetical protein [Prolixibacteraceae bacterium]